MKKENEEREKRKKGKKKSDLHYLSLSRVKYGQINIFKHLQLKATCKEHTEPRLLIICNMKKCVTFDTDTFFKNIKKLCAFPSFKYVRICVCVFLQVYNIREREGTKKEEEKGE